MSNLLLIKLLSIFTNWFTLSSMSRNYQTLFASKRNVQSPSVQTTSYGKTAFALWLQEPLNDIQKE